MSESNGVGIPSVSNDAMLAEVVAEITDRLNAGDNIDLAAYAARCPGREEQLKALVEALCLVERAGSSPPNAYGDEPAPEALGDFRIIREVGRGGMGVVYEAEQLSLGRRVALKVLPYAATMDPRHLQRFRNEARAAASLHHEHIVPVHAVGNERGVHFIAMQFIEGVTLAQVIRELHSPTTPANTGDPTGEFIPAAGTSSTLAAAGLSTENGRRGLEFYRSVAKLMIQAAKALEHAHSMGVVHRDVKPGNLMIDSSGKLWVTDFGLARFGTDADLTMSGDFVGTLRYMSPEQALAHHGLVDHRTDVYALGATMYELLTGKPAVSGEDKQEILRQIAFEELVAPRQGDNSIPADLEVIVLKALEKTPEDRYATAQELAEDLRRHLENRPIAARRPSMLQRMRKWARRNKGPLLAATIVFGALVAGLVGTSLALLD
ncbi:MAG TPA: serine/threonine-protein kinase, partial [Gemmataceae bacterium]|nr:serine/threonine-protein kinase [Gemmataceae bacterium]